ncbi:MAG: hypothetical protein WDM92_00915 [Caulobacteraceae bacterium]
MFASYPLVRSYDNNLVLQGDFDYRPLPGQGARDLLGHRQG